MESRFAIGKVGVFWVDDVFFDLGFLDGDDFSFDVFDGIFHMLIGGVDVDQLGSILWEFSELVGDSLFERVEFAGFNDVFEFGGV